MSPACRLERARQLKDEFPEAALCQALSVHRSSLRRKPLARDMSKLIGLVQVEALRWPQYGARRMHAHLKRMGVSCTRGEISKIYKHLNLLFVRPARRPPATTNSKGVRRFPNLTKGLVLDRPNQLWVADVTSVPVASRWAYLSLVMDAFTRRILGWKLSFRNDTSLTLGALNMALNHEKPQMHHSDGGTNYWADRYANRLRGVGAALSMAPPKRPQDNGKAERLNRTIKEEEVRRGVYETLAEAISSLGNYITRYNEERIHQALGYITPKEALNKWLQDQARKQKTSLN